MGNCLKTQLKEAVDNPLLPHMDSHVYKFVADREVIEYAKPCIFRQGVAYEDSNLTTPIANNVSWEYEFYLKENEEYIIEIPYETHYIMLLQSNLVANIMDFQFNTELTQLNLSFSGCYGSVESFIEKFSANKGTDFTLALACRRSPITFNGQPLIDLDINFTVTRSGNTITLDNEGTIAATYDITTGTWTYNS